MAAGSDANSSSLQPELATNNGQSSANFCAPSNQTGRPLILITDSAGEDQQQQQQPSSTTDASSINMIGAQNNSQQQDEQQPEEQVEVIDGIRYRIVAAVTAKPNEPKPLSASALSRPRSQPSSDENRRSRQADDGSTGIKLSSIRRKSSAFVANLVNFATSKSSNELANSANNNNNNRHLARPRRLSIYEMTKSPPPETSLEMYLSERRRSSTVSSKQVQQQLLEQQSTFETNYCQRQQYFKDLNLKLINHDKRLLNVVANRGQIHRHSVDIAQLPLHLALAKNKSSQQQQQLRAQDQLKHSKVLPSTINQLPAIQAERGELDEIVLESKDEFPDEPREIQQQARHVSIRQDRSLLGEFHWPLLDLPPSAAPSLSLLHPFCVLSSFILSIYLFSSTTLHTTPSEIRIAKLAARGHHSIRLMSPPQVLPLFPPQTYLVELLQYHLVSSFILIKSLERPANN